MNKVEVLVAPNEYTKELEKCVSIFLAGGISNCPDWQSQFIDSFTRMVEMGSESEGLSTTLLVNPRRYDFDISNQDMSLEQIRWEFNCIDKADAIIFWFPKETLCPITLFELASVLYRKPLSNIIVGVHPEYARKFDIEEQLRLAQNLQMRWNPYTFSMPTISYDLESLVRETYIARCCD